VPPSVKLFVDEHLDAPPAIFTVKAIQAGPAALIFSVWQDGGQIASISHLAQVVDAGERPKAGISAGSYAIPVQPPAATVINPTPLPSSSARGSQSRHDLRRWLGLVTLLWVVAGLAAPLPTLTAFILNPIIGPSVLPVPPAFAALQYVMWLLPSPTLIIAFAAVQIMAAYLYWRNRRSQRLGHWLPATLLVGFFSLLAGYFIAIAILLRFR
jgi:hypothetical protein